MAIQIIADSCCDATPELLQKTGMKRAPLTITIDGNKQYIDDENIDIQALLQDMHNTRKPLQTAAPAPEAYAELMRLQDTSVVVTLSSKLSGSYNSAMAARAMVLEETPQKSITVLDSKSASAGETRIVLKLHEMIENGFGIAEIIDAMPKFVSRVRTLFVLEDLTTLIKNGRIPKMLGMLATALMFRPIMGENGNGEIVQVERVRGTAKALTRLVETIVERTKQFAGKSITLTLSYCNCKERATQLKEALLAACPAIATVVMMPTSGLSSSYANDGGIVVAYA